MFCVCLLSSCLKNSASKLVVEIERKKNSNLTESVFVISAYLKNVYQRIPYACSLYKISREISFEFLHPLDIFRFGAALQNNLAKKYLFPVELITFYGRMELLALRLLLYIGKKGRAKIT